MNKLFVVLGSLCLTVIFGTLGGYILANPTPKRFMIILGIGFVVLLMSGAFVRKSDAQN